MDNEVMKLTLDEKLQCLFLQLSKKSTPPIEDDTVLQKLQTSLQNHIEKKENSLEWCDQIGLSAFICASLKEDWIQDGKDIGGIAFALHCFASLVAKEESFGSLSQQQVMENFKQALPYIRTNMSLSSNALKVANSLISHSSGLNWVLENGIWENLLITSLKSQSIFVQRACVDVITSLLLKVEDIKKFGDLIQDLKLVLYKFREARHHLMEESEGEGGEEEYCVASAVANLKFNTSTVLSVFHNLLFKTLGIKSLYSELQQFLDFISKILFRFNFHMKPETVIRLSKLLLLSTLHKFQGKILQVGTSEQHCIDSITSDILCLTRHMINKGYQAEFLLASFEIHKYWMIMCKNLKERNNVELSKSESIIFVLLRFQMVPLRCASPSRLIDTGTEEYRNTFEQNYIKWKEYTISKMSINEEHKVDMISLVYLFKEKVTGDTQRANEQCITHLLYSTSVTEYLHRTSAFILLQMLIFILKFKIEASSTLDYNPRFYLNAIDCVKQIIARFEIDWANCYESKSLFPLLCSVVWIPGITTRVKVITLQTMTTCVSKLIPPLTTNEYSDKLDEPGFDKLAQTAKIYLSDMEWEVRDCSLELILTCIKGNKEKYPFLIDWFLGHGLLDHVLQAVGDIEPYVQATALAILCEVVSVDKIWSNLQDKGLKQKALRAVVRSGEGCVRKIGLQLLQALIFTSKFESDEIDRFVIPIIQGATTDMDDEIRLAALKFIYQHLDMELVVMGMVDGEFPKVIFQFGKIIQLEEKNVESRMMSIICCFCQNGYFRSVAACSKDNAESVAMESNSILCFIEKLVQKYNLTNGISSCLTGKADITSPDGTMVKDEGKPDIKSAKCTDPSPPEEKEGIKYVLETSDLSVISKLQNKSSFDWWNGEDSDMLLMEHEIPLTFKPVDAEFVFKVFKSVKNANKIENDNSGNIEDEISLLLDDIFLVTESNSEENEARSRDCY